MATALWNRFCQARGDNSWNKSCASWFHVHHRLCASLFKPATSSFNSAPDNGFLVIRCLEKFPCADEVMKRAPLCKQNLHSPRQPVCRSIRKNLPEQVRGMNITWSETIC